jgi:hypothetical protein
MRRSKKQRMQQLSMLLALVLIIALAVLISAFDHRHWADGFRALGAAVLAATALLAFTLRTACRVTTSRNRPCQNDAYGFLFGCGKVPGHRLAKFYARLGLQREAVRSVTPAGGSSTSYRGGSARSTQPDPRTVVVTVNSGGMGACGFWFSLVSTVAAVASVILGILAPH